MDEDWHKYRLQGEQSAQAGNYAQAEAMWAMAALIAQGFAAKDPRFAFSLDNLGQVLARQGKFPLAEYVLGRAWQTKTQVNVSQIEAARTLNIVSELYFYQKRFEESEQLISRVLSVYQTIYGRDHAHSQEVARNLQMIQQARMAANPTGSSAYVPSLTPSAVAASQAEQSARAVDSAAASVAASSAAAVSASGQPETASYTSAQAVAAQPGAASLTNPTTASYTAAPAVTSANANPAKAPVIAASRRAASYSNKCEVCGYEIDGEWCGRCTGTSMKAISPENRLK